MKDLLNPPARLQSEDDAIEIKYELEALGFVRFPGGPVLIGNENGLPCSIEGSRRNETPSRIIGFLLSIFLKLQLQIKSLRSLIIITVVLIHR